MYDCRVKACWVTVYLSTARIFSIDEPSTFNSRWYSHKLKAAGLWYEVAEDIESGYWVWCYGQFGAGEWPDIKIYKYRLEDFLLTGERVIGYNGLRALSCVNDDAY